MQQQQTFFLKAKRQMRDANELVSGWLFVVRDLLRSILRIFHLIL